MFKSLINWLYGFFIKPVCVKLHPVREYIVMGKDYDGTPVYLDYESYLIEQKLDEAQSMRSIWRKEFDRATYMTYEEAEDFINDCCFKEQLRIITEEPHDD